MRPANVADVDMIEPLLDYLRLSLTSIWPIGLVIGDKGYVSASTARRLRERFQIALIVRSKNDMKLPDGCDTQGYPLCPEQERLIWDDYDPGDGVLLYRGDPQLCTRCWMRATCPKQFEFNAALHETFFGMVPLHSRLANELMRVFRPRIEQGFNTAKNRFRLRDFSLNSLLLAQMLCTMCDILDIAFFLAQQRPQNGRQMRNALIRDLNVTELWD